MGNHWGIDAASPHCYGPSIWGLASFICGSFLVPESSHVGVEWLTQSSHQKHLAGIVPEIKTVGCFHVSCRIWPPRIRCFWWFQMTFFPHRIIPTRPTRSVAFFQVLQTTQLRSSACFRNSSLTPKPWKQRRNRTVKRGDVFGGLVQGIYRKQIGAFPVKCPLNWFNDIDILEFPGNDPGKPLWVTASNRKHMARVGGQNRHIHARS